jgi:hypothetical protein
MRRQGVSQHKPELELFPAGILINNWINRSMTSGRAAMGVSVISDRGPALPPRRGAIARAWETGHQGRG